MSEERDAAARFSAYVEALAGVIGHADREKPLSDYCRGLLTPCERKSVEPLAAITAPARTSAQHQSLLHFVGAGGWSDEDVLAKVREVVLPAIEEMGPIEAWILDDTGFPKKGTHSVGVARQYCGQLGKQENCQVAVSLSLANAHASLPVAYRLYLPKDWASDAERREETHVPEDIAFKTKARDRARSHPLCIGGGTAARGCADGRGLRRQQRISLGDQPTRAAICGRRSVEHERLAAGR